MWAVSFSNCVGAVSVVAIVTVADSKAAYIIGIDKQKVIFYC